MDWNEDLVKHYVEWEKSKSGRFALEREKDLILKIIYDWKRRHQRLLDIGCGTGYFLEMFWKTGFDITGVDSSLSMLDRSKSRLGYRAGLHLGTGDHLPFEDKEFDYVSILTVLEFCHDPVEVLREARRVCKKEILIGFLNSCSFYYLTNGLNLFRKKQPGLLQTAKWRSMQDMRKLIKKAIGVQDIHMASILIGPKWTWSYQKICKKINTLILPMNVGGYGLIRVSLGPEKIGTPLMALNTRPKVT